jgi:hypothetical protein
MLTGRAFPVIPHTETALDDPVHQTRVEPVDGLWRVWWTHPFLDEMLGCLLLDDDVTADHYLARYEWSRETSPFNTRLHATRNVGDARVTFAFGQRFERRANHVEARELGDERVAILVEEFGYSEEIVSSLPPDEPWPVPSQA